MTPEKAAAVCLELPASVEEQPFGSGVDVYKVEGRVFALVQPAHGTVSLKCDPEYALSLRQQFEAVTPGYHLNKKHWNSVLLAADVPDDLIEELIEHSWDRVVEKMTKADAKRLRLQLGR